MTAYTSYHHMITPPTSLMPSDNFGLQTQQYSQLPSHMANRSTSQLSHHGLNQIPGQVPHQTQSHFPPIAQRSVSYSVASHPFNYSYSSQNAIPQGSAITASSSAYMQPQQLQSQRLPSISRPNRLSSYSLSDINSSSQYGSDNYQLSYPMKNIPPSSNYNPIGSYNVNGTTFYVPSVPVDHGDYISRSQQQLQQQQQQQQKQQQQQQQNYNNNDSAVTGGVSAKLDYNLEEMSEFIATKSLDIMGRCPGMIKPELSAKSFVDSFTKFTYQVLTATRLPKSTLILSLVYLSDRWSKGNIPKTNSVIHEVYKMLVVALLLANKFHDDNTFTNKSWHEATGVPVADLGLIESDWLRAIQWTLHLEKSQGWDEWNQVYEYWLSNHRKTAASVAAAAASSYRSSYTPPTSYNSYPLSPLPSPESSSIPTEKARQLYSSPPPLSYISYNNSNSKWYSGNNVGLGSNAVGMNNANQSSSATISNTLSRSSSMSTLATPPSTYSDSYAPYFQQQSLNGCGYDNGVYQRQDNLAASHYIASYGSTGCSCPDCSFESVSKVPNWNYGYATAC